MAPRLLSARVRQILERGHEISKRDWRLIRVAIVGLEGTVFLGCALTRRKLCTVLSGGLWMHNATHKHAYAKLQGPGLTAGMHVKFACRSCMCEMSCDFNAGAEQASVSYSDRDAW